MLTPRTTATFCHVTVTSEITTPPLVCTPKGTAPSGEDQDQAQHVPDAISFRCRQHEAFFQGGMLYSEQARSSARPGLCRGTAKLPGLPPSTPRSARKLSK